MRACTTLKVIQGCRADQWTTNDRLKTIDTVMYVFFINLASVHVIAIASVSFLYV